MAVRRKTRKVKKSKTRPSKGQKAAAEKLLRVKLVRSLAGRPPKQREVVKGLGLRKINSEVMRRDSPEVWGMINKVHHLVSVEKVSEK
ncbi:MAG: 50S ribosomal protein L30 [Candidatus Aminicenantes bacterium]